MGVVYTAVDRPLGRVVAVKVLLTGRGADPGAARRFRDEARIAGRLEHPGVPPSTTSANSPTAGRSWP